MKEVKPVGFFEGLMMIAKICGAVHNKVDKCMEEQQKAVWDGWFIRPKQNAWSHLNPEDK